MIVLNHLSVGPTLCGLPAADMSVCRRSLIFAAAVAAAIPAAAAYLQQKTTSDTEEHHQQDFSRVNETDESIVTYYYSYYNSWEYWYEETLVSIEESKTIEELAEVEGQVDNSASDLIGQLDKKTGDAIAETRKTELKDKLAKAGYCC